MKISMHTRWRAVALQLLALAFSAVPAPAIAQDLTEMIADAAGVPQIPAFLPDKYSIQPTEPLSIDGVWMVSSLRKKIRIEQGRAYAVDPWLHLFVLKIQPDMVVMQNMRRTGTGTFAADDLPLMGPAVMTLNGSGNLDVSVQGALGPAKYGLVRLESHYPDELSSEIMAATGRSISIQAPPAQLRPAVQEQPRYQAPPISQPPAPPTQGSPDCVPIGVDPDTGLTICAD